MAVPKTTETRCSDGSVQARQVITQATPSLHLSFYLKLFCEFSYENSGNINAMQCEKRKMWGWGCLCSLFITCLACTLPSLHLVSVVFGTAIPTSLYILENIFHTCLCTFSCTIVHKMFLQISFKIQQTYQ